MQNKNCGQRFGGKGRSNTTQVENWSSIFIDNVDGLEQLNPSRTPTTPMSRMPPTGQVQTPTNQVLVLGWKEL